jgi:AcrR family transcriptional regulator
MVLDAARRIARAEGWGAVTIRRVASALGYASPLIYEHFRDKDDALLAILHEGFGALALALEAAAERPIAAHDADAYVLGLADAYVAFAHAEPALYRLMHGMGGVALDPTETGRGAALVCDVAVRALERWAAAAGVRLPDPLAATEALWSTLHGITCLALAGRLDARSEVLMPATVGSLLAGWRVLHAAPGG